MAEVTCEAGVARAPLRYCVLTGLGQPELLQARRQRPGRRRTELSGGHGLEKRRRESGSTRSPANQSVSFAASRWSWVRGQFGDSLDNVEHHLAGWLLMPAADKPDRCTMRSGQHCHLSRTTTDPDAGPRYQVPVSPAHRSRIQRRQEGDPRFDSSHWCQDRRGARIRRCHRGRPRRLPTSVKARLTSVVRTPSPTT